MQEYFLHFLWQFQYFDRSGLCTTDGELVQIIRTGVYNTNAGPDFTQARIQIGGVEWVGNVEIHLQSSDWKAHQHHHDAAYNNVILHVVWNHNQTIHRTDGTPIPTIELKSRTDIQLLTKYNLLINNGEVIPCASQFSTVKDIHKIQALDKSLMQRLQSKAWFVKELFCKNQQDWEETAYQLLAYNFGFKTNSDPFLRLAQSIPLKVIQKHSNNLLQVEALLFGQAGLLPGTPDHEDTYVQLLQREYHFLSHKYQLSAQKIQPHEWKFSKLRPANFPTLRIAQFAAFLGQQKSLFSTLVNLSSVKEALQLLETTLSTYWQTHYTFEKETSLTSAMGKSSRENIILNTVVPLLVCYGEENDNKSFLDKAIRLLEELPAEDNHIIRIWEELKLPVKTAFDSQACIELYNHFCKERKCLSCPVGVSLLRN